MYTQLEKDEIVNTFLETMQNYNTMKKDIDLGRVEDADTWRVKTPIVQIITPNQDLEGL